MRQASVAVFVQWHHAVVEVQQVGPVLVDKVLGAEEEFFDVGGVGRLALAGWARQYRSCGSVRPTTALCRRPWSGGRRRKRPCSGPVVSAAWAGSYHVHERAACTVTPKRSPAFRAALAHVPTMSFLGPTFIEFQGWYLESKQSKLQWWLAKATKYFAPARLYKSISFSGPTSRPSRGCRCP